MNDYSMLLNKTSVYISQCLKRMKTGSWFMARCIHLKKNRFYWGPWVSSIICSGQQCDWLGKLSWKRKILGAVCSMQIHLSISSWKWVTVRLGVSACEVYVCLVVMCAAFSHIDVTMIFILNTTITMPNITIIPTDSQCMFVYFKLKYCIPSLLTKLQQNIEYKWCSR